MLEQAPDTPWLAEREIHVWLADLLQVGECALSTVLSADERARAARFPNANAGQLWARARGVLRALLALYIDAEPAAVRFTSGPHGKPGLLHATAAPVRREERHPGEPAPIEFNVSHSAGLALYGFSRQRVGVDIEAARSRRLDAPALAARAFGTRQSQRLGARPPAERERAFMRLWTRYEALQKSTGLGITVGDADTRQPNQWVTDLDVGPGAVAAVAADHPPSGLRCWPVEPGTFGR
jgi:4'-phosphopantetheinyl transferase